MLCHNITLSCANKRGTQTCQISYVSLCFELDLGPLDVIMIMVDASLGVDPAFHACFTSLLSAAVVVVSLYSCVSSGLT